MSLIHYNLDTQCDVCRRMFDSWTDLECPYCPKTPKKENKPSNFKKSMIQKAECLFERLLKGYKNEQ